ncbi:MAG: ABC transporter ATP-binding protein/permease [Armatimonadetes bacterium]|nr:ABC transporter ATP-binding protein/permease [Armatimonadota bacterium]MDW8122335.1 ABC transporter ATP-binding protein [Armatimonadota bacterium]
MVKEAQTESRDSQAKDPIVRLLPFIGRYWKRALLCLILIFLADGARLYFIWLTQPLLKPLIRESQLALPSDPLISFVQGLFDRLLPDASRRATALFAVCGVGAFLAIGRAGLTFAHTFLSNSIAQKVILDLRYRLYSHLQRMSAGFFDRQTSSRLLSRVISDVAALQGLIAIGIEDIVSTPYLAVGSLVMMILISPPLTLIALVMLPLVGYLLVRMGMALRRASHQTQVATGELVSLLRESLGSIRLVKALGAEKLALAEFDRRNRQVYRHSLRGIRARTLLTPATELIATMGVLAGVLFGGLLVVNGHLLAEELVPFMISFYTLATSIRKLSHIQAVREQVAGATERIFEILDTPPEITDAPDAVSLPSVKGSVVFEKVRFQYETGEEVLKGVSFRIEPSQKVALVGSSGVGKTTIALLLARLYEPNEGRILIDDHDIRKIRLESLRKAVGLVFQDAFLIEGTVRDNLLLGCPEATVEEMEEAAKIARAHEFIVRLPNGYDTWVGEGGSLLSVGQRQRIALARALLRKPAILILDEVTSHLDAESEAAIQAALEEAMKGRTVLIIAHRLSTVRNADKILVLDDGVIVEEGTHEELLSQDSRYARLYRLQAVR